MNYQAIAEIIKDKLGPYMPVHLDQPAEYYIRRDNLVIELADYFWADNALNYEKAPFDRDAFIKACNGEV